jgi:hypothetical protein
MGPGAIGGPKNKVNKKGTAVITIDELERIKAQCTLTQDTSYQQMKTQQAKSLQGTSKSRVKNWPNTMEAMRLRREEERIRRLEDEEVSLTKIVIIITYLIVTIARLNAGELMLKRPITKKAYATPRSPTPTSTCTRRKTRSNL